jgi:cysteine desulfurase/selenocysteine lyase
MYKVEEIRKHFPMLNNDISMQGKPLIFLDNCSTTFKPQCVIDAIEYYNSKITSNSHRGDYDLCYAMDVNLDEIRTTVASFVNCDKNEVIFTSGTTDSLNKLALSYGLQFVNRGDEILISIAEHASNILPWFKVAELTGGVVKYIPLDEKGRITPENLRKVITNKTKIVSVAQVSNVLGYINDVKELAKVCHEFGAVISVDGAQSVPHIKVDFKDLDIDFLSFSAHKMCGPSGVGALIGKYNLINSLDPIFMGGGMNAKFHTDTNIEYLEAPAKFEAGTLNLAGLTGLKAAIEFINEIGIENIEKHDRELKKYCLEQLEGFNDIIIYNKDAETGIITFNIKGVFAQDEATLLNSHGIAVRSGQHCAKLLNDFLKTPATCRMSTYLYTTKEEIDAFVDAIKNGGDILDAFFN